MKKKLLCSALFICTLPMLTSCASQNEVASLQYQLLAMNQKMEQMQKDTKNEVRRNQASSNVQISQMEEEIMVLKNQLEATNEVNNRLKKQNNNLHSSISDIAKQEADKREAAIAQLQKEQDAKQAELARLKDDLAHQQEKVKAIQQARLRDAEKRATAAKQASQTAQANYQQARSGKKIIRAEQKKIIKTKNIHTAPKTTPKQVASSPTPKTQATKKTTPPKANIDPLLSGQSAFDKKDYDTAYTAFEKVAKGNYDKKTTINALYMMGECRFAQKEYDSAVVRYQEVIRNYPTSPQSASALYKQAASFGKINEKETAQMLYKKVVEKYPQSKEAALATKALNK